MADWADVQSYQDMIEALGTFCTDVNQSCETMMSAAQTCKNTLNNDVASLKACKQLAISIKGYQEAIAQAQKLATALEEEKNDIINMLKTLDED